MTNYEVEWTGQYPILSFGNWIIRRNGVDVSDLIPRRLFFSPMGTRKMYYRWCLTDDGLRFLYPYYDGLSAKKWIRKNRYWIKHICRNGEEEFMLYHAINKADWRWNSQGDCI